MGLKELLVEQGKLLSADLTLNDQGICHLAINRDLAVTVERPVGANHFFLYGIVSTLTNEDLPAFSKALEGNLFHKETGLATLGYEPNSHSFVLFQRFSNAIDFPTYQAAFSQFLQYYAYWKKKLQAKETAQPLLDQEIMRALGQQKLSVFIP